METNKLTFRLKQHTPLIHFQHHQEGATLRATELKPKLDRFLIREFEKMKYDYSGYLLMGQDNALDYKVRISAYGTKKVWEINSFPCFFGNMCSNEKKKLIINEGVEIVIFSKHRNLLEQIEDSVESFISENNFGTRQSKGFGSFYLKGREFSDGFDLRFNIPSSLINSKGYDWLFLKNVSSERNINEDLKRFARLFACIDIFYRSLRSGINRPGRDKSTQFYMKPAVFLYAKDRLKAPWDKKTIKQHFFRAELNKQVQQHNFPDILTYEGDRSTDNEKLLIKDLFGLSSTESWKYYRKTLTKDHPEITRFRSPLIFKIISNPGQGFTIGIKAKSIPDEYFNQKFTVRMDNMGQIELNTPKNFDWKDFFGYLKQECSSISDRAFSDASMEDQPEYKVLSTIYNQF